MGYTSCYDNESTDTDAVTIDELLSRIANSKIMLVRTHGYQNAIEASNGNITSEMMLELPDDFFSYSELVVYGACFTGQGGEGAENVVNATKTRGSKTVVGFEENVKYDEVNAWCEKFFEALAEGNTVEEACESASEYILSEWRINTSYSIADLGTDSFYIAGDKTAVFN